jgi:glycerophosphoryl diester phosphodiesterase
VDFVELDVRTSSDGYLVLMHDPTVDRMTNGKGRITDMTFAEIRKLDLGARFPGKFPDLRIPTFDEALELAKGGKIGIYVDTKNAGPKDLIAAIERHDMGDHVMFWSERVNFLKEIAELRPSWKLMPEAFNPSHVQELMTVLHPPARLRSARFQSSHHRRRTPGQRRDLRRPEQSAGLGGRHCGRRSRDTDRLAGGTTGFPPEPWVPQMKAGLAGRTGVKAYLS